MPDLKKSDLVISVIKTLIEISGRKTSRGHALFTMENTLKKLEGRYSFLKDVKIIDNRYSEYSESVDVTTTLEDTEPTKMGEAIHDIITTMNSSLGSGAGHFFIKELRRNLDDEYVTSMRKIGVDLGIMQLEHEVAEMEKAITKKK